MIGPPLPIILLLAVVCATAHPLLPGTGVDSQTNKEKVSFRPSIAFVIGIFAIMFSLTFFLLMYAKFCHTGATNLFANGLLNEGSRLDDARDSGIDKAVIESLPFFQFSVLKGSREGLECAVCLSRFNDAEVLRLLPRCKHAFHMDCIDRWLDTHSSCPLCRTRVDVDDIAFYKYSASSRYHLRDHSDLFAPEGMEDGIDPGTGPGTGSGTGSGTGPGPGFELYVEREHAPNIGSMSRRFTSTFRWAGKHVPLHNFRHRILESDVVFRNRWSDFNSADLINLDSEMLRAMASRRFDPVNPVAEGVSRKMEEMEMKTRLGTKAVNIETPAKFSSEFSARDRRALISPTNRCMSDITEVRRYTPSESYVGKEEKVRQVWLPIARRTVNWCAGKERWAMLGPHNARDDA